MVRTRRRSIPLAALLLAGGAGVFVAQGGVPVVTQHPLDATTLMLKSKAGGAEKFLWVAKLPPPVLPASDPEVVGATLTLTGTNQTVTVDLPGGLGLWTENDPGTLNRFSNPDAPGGPSPVKVGLIKEASVLKIVAKDTILDLDDVGQGAVAVQLTIGTDVYCSLCDIPTIDVAGEFKAVHCEAPGACF